MRLALISVAALLLSACSSAPKAMIHGDGARQGSNPNEFNTRLVAVDGQYLNSDWSDRAPVEPGRRLVMVESLQPAGRALDDRRRYPLRQSLVLDVADCTEVRLKAVHEVYWSSRFTVEVAEVKPLAACEPKAGQSAGSEAALLQPSA